MVLQNRTPLIDRVTRAAENALSDGGTVTPLDMLLGIGWADPNQVRRWQQGQIGTLEETMQTSPARVAEAMRLFRGWAEGKGLLAGEAQYVARSPQREPLRFTRAGDPAAEAQFRTHYVSPALPEKQRERLAEQASRPPELVVIIPHNHDWKCHRCGGTGGMLIMEPPGPSCLRCVGLDDLQFLGAGDALLTRRTKARSARSAMVVRFSRARKRYERQGLLVEAAALASTEQEIAAERARKAGTSEVVKPG